MRQKKRFTFSDLVHYSMISYSYKEGKTFA